MVKITIPSSSASLTTKGTAKQQSPSSLSGEAIALQNLGEALSQTSDVFRQSIINEQVADAQIAYTQKLNQNKLETLANPELTEADSIEFGNQAVEDLQPFLDTIGDPAATRQFEINQRASILGATNSVRKAGRVAQQDRYVVKGGEVKTQSLGNAFSTNDPVMQIVERKKYVDYLNRGVPFNITREEREKQIAIYDEEFRVGKVQHDYNALTANVEGRSSAQRVLGALEFLDGLDDKYNFKKGEAESWKNNAESFIKRQAKNVVNEIQTQQQESARKAADQVRAGEADVGQIIAANANDPVASEIIEAVPEAGGDPQDTGALSNADMKILMDALGEYKPKVTTNNPIWQEIRNNIDGEPAVVQNEDGTTEQRQLTTKEIDRKIFSNLMELDEEDYQGLIDANISEKKTATQNRRNIEDKSLKGRIANAVSKNVVKLGGSRVQQAGEGLSTFANSFANEYSARFLRKAIDEKLTGNDLQEAANDMYDEFLKDNGMFVGKGKTPNVTIGIEGEVKRLLGGKSFATPDFKLVPTATGQEEETEQ